MTAGTVIALVGGVGGAKLAVGLAAVLPPERLLVVVNVGDDFRHLGLAISPDLDTVLYTMAGLADPEQGWGLAGETWQALAALERLGEETWFKLGDRDLATHIARTRRLAAGETLSAVTRHLAQRLGVAHPVTPASDDPIRTIVDSSEGELAFQDYFVRRRCEPQVRALRFQGAERARPAPSLARCLAERSVAGIVIGPSNPFLSIAPILAIPAIAAALGARAFPVVAVSPLIAGRAVKGPAAKLMAELGHDVSALGVAGYYRDILDGVLIDEADAVLEPAIAALGIAVRRQGILMQTDADKAAVARGALAMLERLRKP